MKKQKIFVINGAAQSGKDTFVNLVRKEYYKLMDEYIPQAVENLSTVDRVKAIASVCGWNGSKDEKSRKFLSDLKLLLIEWDDVPFKDIQLKVERSNAILIFIHCREPNEIRRLCDEFAAKSILIRNNRVEKIMSNSADANVEDYVYDYVIDNNGTMEEFAKTANTFIKSFIEE